MIRALSPYYITTPLTYLNELLALVTCETFTLTIEVWDGESACVGCSKEIYEIAFANTQESTGSHDININAIIQDYIDFDPKNPNTKDTQVMDADNQRWVRTFVNYDGIDKVTYHETLDFMTLGYAYGDEGRNFDTVEDDILMKAQDYKVSREGFFTLPFLASATDTLTVDAVSSPDSEINFNWNVGTSSNSAKQVQLFWINLNETTTDEFVTLTVTNDTTSVVSTVILDIVNECKYAPLDVMFQNKDGAAQMFTFFKRQKESMTVTDKTFETNRGQASDGYHQFVRHNVQGQTTLSAETGFIDEDNNEVLKQMMLSERIWMYEGVNFIPLNIDDKSIKYKTRQNERLVSYTIKFKKSYNEVNNI